MLESTSGMLAVAACCGTIASQLLSVVGISIQINDAILGKVIAGLLG